MFTVHHGAKEGSSHYYERVLKIWLLPNTEKQPDDNIKFH